MRAPDLLTQIAVAAALLTRLPLPRLSDDAFAQQARAAWAYPLIGIAVGGGGGLVGVAAILLGLPPLAAAGLCVATQIALSGGMHEDGLADCCDGFWGGFDRERRLNIMKDSHIGTYGVLGLVIATGLKWAAMTTLLITAPLALVAAAVLSRAMMPVLMYALPRAREGGLSARVGRPAAPAVAAGLGLALAIAWLCLGPVGGFAVVAAGFGALCVAGLARAKIGGQTGDVLGACQHISETLTLLALAAVI